MLFTRVDIGPIGVESNDPNIINFFISLTIIGAVIFIIGMGFWLYTRILDFIERQNQRRGTEESRERKT